MATTDDTGGVPRSPKKHSPRKITIKGPQPPPTQGHHHRNPPKPPSPSRLPPPLPLPQPPPVSYHLVDDEDDDQFDSYDDDEDFYDDEWPEDIGEEDFPEDEEDMMAETMLLEYQREWKERKAAMAAKKQKYIEEVNRKWREETGKLGWRYSEPDEHGRRKMYFVDPNSNKKGEGEGDANGDEDGKSNKDPPLP